MVGYFFDIGLLSIIKTMYYKSMDNFKPVEPKTQASIRTSKHTLPRALEKLAELAGIYCIKIHAPRHSHGSLLINMGENPLLIKERLGHEKIQTTLGTYGHLYPNTNLEVTTHLL